MSKAIHEGTPTVEAVPKKEQMPCVAECSSYDRIASWWMCGNKGKYFVDGLSVCGTHKNYILNYGRLDVVVGEKDKKGMCGRKTTVTKEHVWPYVQEAIQQAEHAERERLYQQKEEARYQSALKRICKRHGILMDELLVFLEARQKERTTCGTCGGTRYIGTPIPGNECDHCEGTGIEPHEQTSKD